MIRDSNFDNESIVYVINKKTTKDPKLLRLLCALVHICLKNNILFRARHIRGTKNILADHLSRLQIEKFKALAPGMNPVPTPLPTHLLPENWGHTLMLLLGASLSTTSLNTYCRPWKVFRQFNSERLHIQGSIFPISTKH